MEVAVGEVGQNAAPHDAVHGDVRGEERDGDFEEPYDHDGGPVKHVTQCHGQDIVAKIFEGVLCGGATKRYTNTRVKGDAADRRKTKV